MKKEIKIKRRIDGGTITEKEITEIATLIAKNDKTVIVQLKNGDIIKRKIKDVIE